MYTGTMLPDLNAIVDNALDLSRKARQEVENARICLTCGHCYGEHSHLDLSCPSDAEFGPIYLESKFSDYSIMDKVRDEDIPPAMFGSVDCGITRGSGTDMTQTRVYLGDSVYADFDGTYIVLTTENGFGASNTIFLESDVLNALNQYADKVRDEAVSD